jgi:hypothetical protein
MDQSPTEQEIADALVASGFLMEQEVATALEGIGFHAETGRAYTDPDEGKSRELDVMGSLTYMRDEAQRAHLRLWLLCECKNTSNPFVFLARQRTAADRARNPEEYLFPMRDVAVQRSAGTQYVAPFHPLGLGQMHYRFLNPVKAVQIVRLDRSKGKWAAENTSVFTSLVYPLAKALRAFQEDHNFALPSLPVGPMPQFDHRNPLKYWAAADLYFPMVIVRSPLWVVDVHDSAVAPKRVPFVTLERELKSKMVSGRFAIDFVEQAAVGDFLAQNVLPFAASVQRALWPDYVGEEP